VILTVTITGLAWAGLSGGVFAGFQRRAPDALLPGAANDPRVVVVGIDRKSIKAEGLTPWPRALQAQLVDRLSADGAAVIAFDITFSTERDGDPQLAASIARAGNVVLGEEVPTTKAVPGQAPEIVGSPGGLSQTLLAAPPSLVGHVQVNKDPADGVVRSLPLVFGSPDGFFPALSLAAVMRYRGVDSPVIVRPSGVQIGDRFIPTDRTKSMLINFSSRLGDPTNEISAVDVLDGTVNPSKLKGRIVFVGATDPTLGDTQSAPIAKSNAFPGVFLHANAVNTMLTGDYLERVGTFQTVALVALLTLLIAVSVLLLPLWLSPVVTALLFVAYYVLAVFRFSEGRILNLVYPLPVTIVAFLGALVLRYFAEARQRRRVTALFSQYVPEAVAQQLVDADRVQLAAEGERLDMTVLFCDLRGFTALSESLEPATVRVMLNHYYDRVTDIVLAHAGTLMKYVGDEVFAVWGAPLPSPDHCAQAFACAMAIQAVTPSLNEELLERGAPAVAFGIGLNTGDAVAAHFGGGRRRQYDVVGDTVNVGARLCSIAGRGEIILPEKVYEQVPSPPPVEEVGPVNLKGVTRELQLLRVPAASATVAVPEPATSLAREVADETVTAAAESLQ
jgi:adenylate cyclase